MRILHLMLSCFYIDNYNYQENVLPRLNKMDGHEVRIIASTATFIDNINLGYRQPGSYINEDGIPVIRIHFKKIINNSISSKLKIYPKVYQHIESFSPDVIFCHGIMMYELKTIINYKKNNPEVRLFCDSHADFNNSALNFFSRYILHGLFYKWLIKRALPYIKEILCISYESIVFLEKIYKIPRNALVLYPLGGEILDTDLRNKKRRNLRKTLNLKDSDILLIHCGKMTKEKRTQDIVRALCNLKMNNIRLILIGTLEDDIELPIKVYLETDPRINYVGWKSANQLVDYLCAGDLYVQPGSQSATMQNALCFGCAAALYPYESHKYLLGDLVFYIKTVEDMESLFEEISLDRSRLEEKRRISFEFAREKLDYKKLAALLYKDM